MYLKFRKICRICLKENKLVPLNTKINEYTIIECLNKLLQYKFSENDGFPKYICENCVGRTKISFDFINLCSNSHKTLLEILVDEKVLIKDEFANSAAIVSVSSSEHDIGQFEVVLISEDLIKTETKNDEDNFTPVDGKNNKCNVIKAVEEIIMVPAEENEYNTIENSHYSPEFGAINETNRHDGFSITSNSKIVSRSTKSGKIKCVCGEIFNRKKELNDHIKEHIYPTTCIACTEQKDENSIINTITDIKLHLARHGTVNNKRHVCETCGKEFKLNYSLVQHQFSHSTEKNFECDICLKKFVFNCTLYRHKINIHSATKRFKCKLCDKAYTGASALKDHMYSHSGQPKPHECKICDKSFYSPSLLKHHMLKHTGERIYCQKCNASFGSIGGYHMHKCFKDLKPFKCKKCHKSYCIEAKYLNHICVLQPEKKSVCDKCGGRFMNNYLLKLHSRVHADEEEKTWVECDICQKKLSSRNCLSKHRKIHTEKPKFECDICSKPFRDSCSLKVHRRIHTGEKPYTCEIENCNRKFSDPSTYYYHKKRHQKI